MKFMIKKIVGYNCPSKWVLCINGIPVVVANSKSRISIMMSYVEGYPINDLDLIDNSVLKVLKAYRDKYAEENIKKLA